MTDEKFYSPLDLPPDFPDQRLYPVQRWITSPRLVNVLEGYGVEHDRSHHSLRNHFVNFFEHLNEISVFVSRPSGVTHFESTEPSRMKCS